MNTEVAAKVLNELLDEYGNVKIKDLLEEKGLPFKCPLCNGKGEHRPSLSHKKEPLTVINGTERLTLTSVLQNALVHGTDECKVCSGEGYTEVEYRLLTEVVVVGYEVK